MFKLTNDSNWKTIASYVRYVINMYSVQYGMAKESEWCWRIFTKLWTMKRVWYSFHCINRKSSLFVLVSTRTNISRHYYTNWLTNTVASLFYKNIRPLICALQSMVHWSFGQVLVLLAKNGMTEMQTINNDGFLIQFIVNRMSFDILRCINLSQFSSETISLDLNGSKASYLTLHTSHTLKSCVVIGFIEWCNSFIFQSMQHFHNTKHSKWFQRMRFIIRFLFLPVFIILLYSFKSLTR